MVVGGAGSPFGVRPFDSTQIFGRLQQAAGRPSHNDNRMKIAVPRERRVGERRVSATPETTRRLVQLGFEVAVEAGAGAGASFADDEYRDAGARLVTDTRKLWAEAEIVLKVQPPDEYTDLGAHEADLIRPGATLISFLWPGKNQAARPTPGRAEGHRAGGGPDPAHHPGAEDGRPLVDGEHRRLPRGDRGGELLRPIFHGSDDCGRARAGGQGAGHRRRRRRARGHRRRPRPWGDRPGVRHPCRRQGPGQEHGRRIPRTARRGRRRGWRRLRQGDEPGVHPGRDGAAWRPGPRRRHHHHDGAHSEPPCAHPDHRRHGAIDEARLGRRRSGGREWRELRADRSQSGGRAVRRAHHRLCRSAQPSGPDRQPPLRQQPDQPADRPRWFDRFPDRSRESGRARRARRPQRRNHVAAAADRSAPTAAAEARPMHRPWWSPSQRRRVRRWPWRPPPSPPSG